MSYSITQNASFLTAASVLQKIISFVYFTIVARLIGVGNTGQYFFAISFTTIFTVVADFGLGPVLTRETSKYPENSERYLMTVFWAKVLFGIFSYGLIILAINLLGYEDSLKRLIYLSGVTMFFDNLHTAFYSIFRARKNLLYESIGVVASQLLTLIIGTIALVNGLPLIWLIAAYAIPAALNAAYSAIAAGRVYHLRYRLVFDRLVFRSFVAIAVPFALSGIIARLYSYADSIIMSKMLGNDHLGWWSVPYKITFAFQFIPAALSASVYPAMSALAIIDQARIARIFERAWSYLFIIVFPLAAGLAVIAKPVIVQLYGIQYLPSVPVLRILLVSLIFGYLSFITGALLNATNHQKIQTALFAAALASNVILNLILLPRIGIVGAASAALVGNIILCGGGLYFSRRYIPINLSWVVKRAWRTAMPGAVVGVVAWWLIKYTHFVFVIGISFAAYVSLLFVLRIITTSQIKEFFVKLRHPRPATL